MKKTFLFVFVFFLSVALRPCPGEAQKDIVFWTTEVEKDRLSVQNQIGRDFTAKTGIGLRVIPVEENLLAERVTAAFAARSLPDVIFHPIDFTIGWTEAGILDARAATGTFERLGKESFAARKWIEFLLSDSYPSWLGMAAEGKLPVRKGTPQDSGRFVEAWNHLEFGVTTRARISQYYGPDAARDLLAALDHYDRWGFAEGKGALVSKIYGTRAIPEILKRFLDGELTAEQAAEKMNDRVKGME